MKSAILNGKKMIDPAVEDFAAQLAEAAYPVMLRRGAVDDWLDLELELWQTLSETVRKWDRDWPRAGVMLASPTTIADKFAAPVSPAFGR